jgi:F0F1-type ATP synthase assembly protein I
MAPYTFMVAPGGHIVHPTQHTGASFDAEMGAVILGALALGLVVGAAPGALIAHYIFNVTWGKSVLIGIGAMIGISAVMTAVTPRPPAVAPLTPLTPTP